MSRKSSRPSCQRMPGLLIGLGRLGLGGLFLAAPETATRLLGLDAVTATRVSWLARMTAIRDCTLGAGTVLSSIAGHGSTPWLLAGAVSDAGDAAAIGLAIRDGRLPAARAGATVALAGGATLAGVLAARPRRAREIPRAQR